MREILDYRIGFNAETRISRKKAILIFWGTAVVLITAGLWLSSMFPGSGTTSYYEYRIGELKEVVRNHPEDRAAVMELAMNLYLNGDSRRAVALARKVYREYPEDPDVLLNLGLMLSDRGDDREAIGLLERLNKLHPGFAAEKANFFLGKSYFGTGNYSKAVISLEKAARMDPGNPAVYYYLGQAHEKLGNMQKALAAYRQAILLAGEYPEAERAVQRLSRR